MTSFTLNLERVEEGHVRVSVLEEDDLSGASHVIWACEANTDDTRKSQTDALKATFTYLNKYVDLSQGGRA